MGDVEGVNARLEQAALTARALQEISGHWDAVYEAMRRAEAPESDDEVAAAGPMPWRSRSGASRPSAARGSGSRA